MIIIINLLSLRNFRKAARGGEPSGAGKSDFDEKVFVSARGYIRHAKSNDGAPDVDAIYAAVREKLPGVGVATVYRVLRDLVAEGKAVTLETTDDRIHYDADVSPHAHFICGKCGRIIDIFETPALTEKAEKMGFTVKSEKTVLYGICPDCAAKNRS